MLVPRLKEEAIGICSFTFDTKKQRWIQIQIFLNMYTFKKKH